MSLLLAAQRALTVPGWAKDELSRKAQATPSLDLRFADNKSLVDATTGQNLVTFTRASSGTYVDSQGVIKTATTNEARFDHNPTTGESLGLLVEESRTNLALRSEQFDDAAWNSAAGARTVTANQITAPDGTTTADLVTADGTNVPHFVSQAFTLSAIPYSLSVFAKAGTESTVILRTFNALGNASGTFNLNTGTVASNSAGTTAQIVAYPNGWYRCILNFTPVATTSSIGIYLSSVTAVTISTTLYLWGAQLEAGAFPTSYIATTAATATRSADVASITGTNFSSWYQAVTGTILFDGINPAVSTTGFSISDGSTNNRIQADTGTSTRIARVVSGGTTQASNSIAYTYSSSQRFALSYATDAINFANAGVLGLEDTSATIPTVDQLRIGANPTGANALNSTIRRLTYWPARLANTTLQQITQ